MEEILQNKIINQLKETKRNGMDKLIDWLIKTDFFCCPASAKYHSNCDEGLAFHSWTTMKIYKKINQDFDLKIPEDSIIIGGLTHDFAKIDFYKKGKRNVKENGKWIEKDVWEIDDQLPIGHGTKSVILLQRFIDLTKFEVLSITHHMGLPEDFASKQTYNAALEKDSRILALHIADLIASRWYEQIIK